MLNIIYEDNHIIVVEKPRNIPVQGDLSGDTDLMTMIKDYLRDRYDKKGNVFLGLIHRLDRPVGGLMVFAKTSKAASRLSEQVRNGTFEKSYEALVHGTPPSTGVFEDYLLKDQKTNISSVVPKGTDGSKYAKLDYKVVGTENECSRVKIHLVTGRSHQIRVQFSTRGFPLLNDVKYGLGEKGNIALYSTGISFLHPTKKERMNFSLKSDF